MSTEDKGECRVVLLGKTGAGKSSLGNTLLGREAFEVGRGLSSGTEKCQFADTLIEGVNLAVVDTPGLCDTHRPEQEVLREVAKSVAVAEPGPHVILMVLRSDRRFTAEEYTAYITLKGMFGNDFCKFLFLVFVGIDQVTGNPDERQSALESLIHEKSLPTLQELISDSSSRYFAVDNKAQPEDRRQQAKDLLSRIQELIQKNGGRYFSNRLCEDIGRDVEPMIQRRIQQDNATRADATRAVRQDIVKENVFLDALKGWVRVIAKALEPVLEQVVKIASEKGLKLMQEKQCSVM
ncbi:GTPase IMAP family member 4-like isoform X1 [Pomacea canaliculata]|uniref:GTPase IMAP family member 4-like isoform X1 n=1 Tax=Pomacea canaliculata TaxID=400727 RepID=UPI000D72592D|nr:GTPase IMAP family member 4-like isoform X1 [Pomacea canaliculata]